MRQEVNLLILNSVENKPLFSFGSLSVFSVVLICSLFYYSDYQSKKLNSILDEIVEFEKKILVEDSALPSVNDISVYQNKLVALEGELLTKYRIWKSYKDMTRSGKNGFSPYFYHIADRANINLSLYEIGIYNRGTSLALKGYAKKAEYIPIYINELKNQEVFKNVRFGGLSIDKVKGHNIVKFSLDKEDRKIIQKSIDADDVNDLIKTTLSGRFSINDKEVGDEGFLIANDIKVNHLIQGDN